MAAINDITGDAITTKVASDAYRDNYDAIFRKKTPEPAKVIKEQKQENVIQTRSKLTEQWWAYCEKNQHVLEKIPTFEEWKLNNATVVQ